MAKYWKKGLIRIALFGMENQTDTDADMPLRVISYDGAAYRNQLNAKDDQSKKRYPVVTMVLYFGYKHHWRKHLNLLSCFNTPEELKPFVNDYRINLFEIAWLSDEEVRMFKSDFLIVADYFVQMRKNRDYVPSKETIRHVHEVLQLMSVMTNDYRFEESYNEIGRSESNMCEVLDAVVAKAKMKTVVKTLTRHIHRQIPINMQVLEDIADDNDLTVEKVRSIAKENNISLSC